MQICAITCLSACVSVRSNGIYTPRTRTSTRSYHGGSVGGGGQSRRRADQQTDRNVAHKLQKWPTQTHEHTHTEEWQHMAKNRKGLRVYE